MLFKTGRWLFRLLYRVEVKGLENYDKAGKRTLLSRIIPHFLMHRY